MPKIAEMYAFIVEDAGPDDEGVAAMQVGPPGGPFCWMPLVGADMARVESLRPIAQRLSRQTGKPLKLIRFTHREEVDILPPDIVGFGG